MELGLQGKVAIVTGGSKGIGRATALALAQEGADVAICARGVEALEEAAGEIHSRTGRRVVSVRADMTAPEDIQNLVASTITDLGGVDILVNNAVNSVAAPFMELPDDAWLNHINVKVMGYVRCAREVIPHMQLRGGGRIINIGGMAARSANVRCAQPDQQQWCHQLRRVQHRQEPLGPGGQRRNPGELHPPRHHQDPPTGNDTGEAGQRRQF